ARGRPRAGLCRAAPRRLRARPGLARRALRRGRRCAGRRRPAGAGDRRTGGAVAHRRRRRPSRRRPGRGDHAGADGRAARRGRRVKVLLWHAHGSWTTAFVQGSHEYLLPVVPGRGADGLGRARTWNWPLSAREVTPEQLREEDVDVVVLQRPRDLELAREWL